MSHIFYTGIFPKQTDLAPRSRQMIRLAMILIAVVLTGAGCQSFPEQTLQGPYYEDIPGTEEQKLDYLERFGGVI